MNPNDNTPEKHLAELIPRETALAYRVVPINEDREGVCFAIDHKPDENAINDLHFILGKKVSFRQISGTELDEALERRYGIEQSSKQPTANERLSVVSEVMPEDQLTSHKVSDNADDVSTVDLVGDLISKAVEQQASDIHIEPQEKHVRVRFRIDGVLQEREPVSVSRRNALISRLKIMADLDIAERRRPQDGRIRMTNGETNIDLRVSTLPTNFGEKVVLRILDKSVLKLDLEVLGLDDREDNILRDSIAAPHGMILVTGPTGSGKTTTLYATLNHLNTEEVNILTIEDPIEYDLAGINQSHMRADIGYSFGQALKTFLRQDPDIIMVGEIRDLETAEIAIRASLTGHLVFSTLHTNDAPSAITRLVDMGVEPFLVASSVRLVVAQRLVRKICPKCRREIPLSGELLDLLNADEQKTLTRAFKGDGCPKCYSTGFHGRVGLFEMMPVTPRLADAVSAMKTSAELKKTALAEGMRPLRTVGLAKVNDGITTVEEVVRETKS